MIKTILQLLVVVAVVNAVARVGMAAWSYYQLKDTAQQVILFGAGVQTSELSAQILDKAIELDVPLEPQDIDVSRDGSRTFVDAFYTQPLEFFPRFVYPVGLSFSVEAFAVQPVTADEVAR